MTDSTNTLSREDWLGSAAKMIESNLLLPTIAKSNHTLAQPMSYKLTMSFPKGSNAAIGQCFPRAASEGDYNEILISLTISDSLEVLEILTHEMVHASDDCLSGHRNYFAAIARGIGLEGKLTATHAGDELKEALLDIIDAIGCDIPHSTLKAGARTKPKQKSRMIKMECTESGCDFNFRASRQVIDSINYSSCLACGESSMSEA